MCNFNDILIINPFQILSKDVQQSIILSPCNLFHNWSVLHYLQLLPEGNHLLHVPTVHNARRFPVHVTAAKVVILYSADRCDIFGLSLFSITLEMSDLPTTDMCAIVTPRSTCSPCPSVSMSIKSVVPACSGTGCGGSTRGRRSGSTGLRRAPETPVPGLIIQ